MNHSLHLLADGPLAGGWVWTILIGIIVGAIAKFLTPGREPAGCIITMLIGVIGAALATVIGPPVHFDQPGETAGFIASVIGAVIVCAIYHLVTRNRGV